MAFNDALIALVKLEDTSFNINFLSYNSGTCPRLQLIFLIKPLSQETEKQSENTG